MGKIKSIIGSGLQGVYTYVATKSNMSMDKLTVVY